MFVDDGGVGEEELEGGEKVDLAEEGGEDNGGGPEAGKDGDFVVPLFQGDGHGGGGDAEAQGGGGVGWRDGDRVDGVYGVGDVGAEGWWL